MVVAAAAALVGVLVGRLTGGRAGNVTDHRVRFWPLVVVAALLHVAVLVDALSGAAVALVLLAAVCLGVFAARNLHLVGMGLVLAGIVANSAVMGLNGGMPVRPSAADRAGVGALGPAHHLEHGGDVLTILGDTIPFSPTDEVLSFGDLVFAVGLADVVAHALHRRPRRSVHRRVPARRRHELGAPVTQ